MRTDLAHECDAFTRELCTAVPERIENSLNKLRTYVKELLQKAHQIVHEVFQIKDSASVNDDGRIGTLITQLADEKRGIACDNY